jgi:hypothetical protein
MAGPIGNLFVTLGLDARPFQQGIKQSQGTLTKFGGAVAAGFGLGAGLGTYNMITQGVSALVDGFGDVVTAASNMTETQTKLDQVFMDSADTMRQWATDSAQSMIMSEQAALESAASFGNFLQALGIGEQRSAEMSRELVQLSADLASYNNLAGGAEEATMRLFSGMSGEMEAVRRLGIDLSETAVKLYLTEKGVKRVQGQFRQADKVAARFALIMQDTAKAQGDVARTAENLANRQREFNAEVGNLQIALGEALVGPMADFTKWLTDTVNFLSGDTGPAFDNLEKMMKAAGLIPDELPKPPGPGDWGLAGTALDSFVDGLNELNTGIQDLEPWSRVQNDLRATARDLGLTDEGLQQFMERAEDAGYTADKAGELFLSMARASRELASDAHQPAESFAKTWGDIAESMAPAGRPWITEMFAEFDSDFQTGFETVQDTIRTGFKEYIAQEIKDGFGSVKDALNGPDNIVDPRTREKNMERRLRKTGRRLDRAIDVGDPFAIRTWTAAWAKQKQNLADFRSLTESTHRDVRGDLKDLGLDTKGIWGSIHETTKRKSRAAADDAIAQARRIRREIAQTDLYQAALKMMESFQRGVRDGSIGFFPGGVPSQQAPAMPRYALSSGGGTVSITVNGLYGGDQGLRDLSRQIRRAIRLQERER